MRSTRLGWLPLASLLVLGCDYPVYGFVPDGVDSAVNDGTVGLDAADGEHADAATETEPDTHDAALEDTTIDTLVVDSLVGDTLTPDTSSDTPVSKGCSGSVHVFCADFDSVLTPQSGWTDTNLVGGGTNLLDKSLFASPTASYVATIPASATGTEAAASLNEDFTLASATPLLRAEMYLRLDAATNSAETLLTKISRVGSGNGVEVDIAPGGLEMNIVGTGSSGSFPMGLPPVNTWFKLKLEVVLATGTGGSAKAYIDDKLVVSQTGIATTTSTAMTARLVIGTYQFNTPITAAKANFDDVTFDTF
jgi:hypothetical protein